MKNSKVLRVSEKNWEKLKNSNNGSMDRTLNILMDTVEQHMPHVEYDSDVIKSVNVYKETANRLDSFRITDTESRDNIITRMFLVLDNLDGVKKIEIPFKLTSPINNKLYMIGVVNQNDIFVTGNSSDTLEFKAWKKLLNWNEIRVLCLNHEDERISFNKDTYRIDINYL